MKMLGMLQILTCHIKHTIIYQTVNIKIQLNIAFFLLRQRNMIDYFHCFKDL